MMDGTAGRTPEAYTHAAQFEELADALLRAEASVDRTSLYLRAEASDFLRFNHAALRQATTVQQAYATIAVERGLRRAESTLTLSGEPGIDARRLQEERTLLVGQLDLIPDDPWLLRPDAATRSHRDERGTLPAAEGVIAQVHELAGGEPKPDFVGFYAGGPVIHAFADSLGSRHWHRVESFHFDWCLYHRADKAVKTAYAGRHWDKTAFAAKLEDAKRQVPLLQREARTLSPGKYRVALSVSAMVDLLALLSWGGFSLKARRTGVSSLMRLERGDAHFDPRFTLEEALGSGTAPAFTATGFLRPERVALVQDGKMPATGGTLNSPRSAAEYHVQHNGAGEEEFPDSLHLAGGNIAHGALLETLDTGLYVSNLWYLNYSDRQAGRMTGMTRFACFWVEHGRLIAPIHVMRFDDEALRMFGAGLVGLTDSPEFRPNSDTYGSRQLASITTPAAIIDGFQLTL